MTNGALAGIKVLDLSRLLPGPYCSMILADHGARVIAIEDKRFKADGLFLTNINRNKEHITLDLKTEDGKKIFFELVQDADIVVEGFRPGVVTRLGVDYQAVSQVNPNIIYCSITGFGQTGPFKDRPGHDNNYLAYSGVLDLIGATNKPPSIPGVQFADIAGGGLNAVIGILLALQARQHTGKGQYIDISMTDGMVGFLPIPLFMYQLLGQVPHRGDAPLSHHYAFYNTYETADGRHISIGALEGRFWKRLCEHLGKPEYIPLQYDEKHREEIIAFMRTTFKQKTMAAWEEDLKDVDTCYGAIQNIPEVLNHPMFRERGMVVDLEDQNGNKAPTIGVAVKLSETPGSVRTPPVDFGASTAKVLEELGYNDEQIQALIHSAKKIIPSSSK